QQKTDFVFLLGLLSHSDILFCTVKHSMTVFFTASSGVPNFPEVVAVMLNDDVEVGYCDSKLKTAIPKQDWMETLRDEDPKYWKLYTGECTVHQQLFKEEFHAVKKRLNQTGAVHIYQRLTCCEWDDETDKVSGFNLYGYDGEDFLTFNMETQTWIGPKPQAVIIKHLWNNDSARNIFFTNYINQVCVYRLKTNLKYGMSFLLRTELPSVSLLQKTPSSSVSCHATGFYPHRAMMFWRRNGEEIHEGVNHGEILPNHDGTFQMSVDLDLSTVTPEEFGNYDCVFQLSGVKKDIITKLDKAMIRTNWVKLRGDGSKNSGPVTSSSTLVFQLYKSQVHARVLGESVLPCGLGKSGLAENVDTELSLLRPL
uniref:Major histocompatibility complex class I-related gene protein-like n=1 Tax=Neolamprologus brichardi TaxID=32507 RepID=A0A3Q4IDN0_NEOBR